MLSLDLCPWKWWERHNSESQWKTYSCPCS